MEQNCATGILHSIITVHRDCRLNRAVLQVYCTAFVLCRQPADWTELCYRYIAQHYYCAYRLQTEKSCATGILHSIRTVQTACRLNRAVLQGYCTAFVLCRQSADWTELCYRYIAQHYYCAYRLQTEQSCATGTLHSITKLCASTYIFIRKCSTVIAFRLTQDIVAVCQHFAVHKQVTRADLHWWNYHNGAATCMGRTAVGAPGEREHGVEEKIISNSKLPGIFNHKICS